MKNTIGDGAVNNHNPTDSHLIETISIKEYQQVLDSLHHARKVALDQVAYENAARGVKSLKVLRFSMCNEGTIGD